MIFWFFIILTALLFAGVKCFESDYEWSSLLVGLGVVSALISVVLLIIILVCNCGAKGTLAGQRERYKALMYKVETESCRDEFGIVNKDYIDEVQSWNEDLSYNKAMQRDFWVGIFIPNIYDEFKLVDLNSIKYKTY